MVFCRTFILSLFYFFLPCNALQCTDQCSFTYNLTTPFNIPDRCNQMVSAGKCLASLQFWYNRGEYTVSLQADSSSTLNNKRSALLEFSSTISSFFSYAIDCTCKNKDDCARDLAKNVAIEMLQRKYNYSAIMNDVQPLLSGPSSTPANPNLNCYDSNQNVQQCGTSTKPGSCVISDTILKKKIDVGCDTALYVGNAYISIYHSDNNYASFDLHCNLPLCNAQSTLQAVKELMFKYNVTKTLDGRLNGSRLIISISLMITMMFILFSNRF